ncbi:type I secretion system permease/ATPase [Vogesella indigofera]|uniref:type I secretion system permease/ATPase n=1 Tax=Vogesella indigofera TaxID=45465 RepID=UPI00234ED596|nr:type I secretion system permease/ATPase [Vogesella indigofera]MDC7709698.1 type I secretion system permease/ATPase [Vogesella indigofera]
MKKTIEKNQAIEKIIWQFQTPFLTVCFFSFITNLLMLAPSIYMMQIYDRVLSSLNETTLLMVTLIILLAYALIGAIEWVRSQLLIRVSLQLDHTLNREVFPATFAASLKGNSNAMQALNDVATLRHFLGGQGLFAFFDFPWAIIYLLIITVLHPWLGFFALIGSAILLALTWLTEVLTQQPLAAANKAAIQANGIAANHLKNAEVITAMGMLDNVQRNWHDRHQQGLNLQEQASSRASIIATVTRSVRLALQSLILGLGALLVIEGSLSAGGMIAASILMGRILSPVEQLIGAWKYLVSAREAYRRTSLLLGSVPAAISSVTLPAPTGQLSIEQITATPPGQTRPVLHNITATIQAGEVIALIGPSASGKSTLARLLVGIWPCLDGKVRLDGADIYEWKKSDLGQYIGYLPQDIELFDGTIAQNIARFGDIDSAAVIQAAQKAGIHQMVLQFASGYDTQIGPGGAFLSAGQRQRLGLARALYRMPKLLVLDEPNSNLDDVGERALAEAILDCKQAGSTVIIITHRTQIIGIADRIMVLKDGTLCLFGHTKDVLAQLGQKKPEPNLEQVK